MATPFILTKEMVELGFHEMPTETTPRLMISTEAHEKCGKTHFMMSAPEPIFFLNFDEGYEGVAKKFRHKRIVKADCIVKPGKGKTEYEKQWKKAKEAFILACDSKRFRTVVVDVADEMWELIRLAEFGKLTQVLPENYGPVNAEFEELMNFPKSYPGLNAIYAHKVGKEYAKKNPADKRGDWTGKYERKGYKNMGYLVQVNLEHYRFTGDGKTAFGIRVKNNRIDPQAFDGLELTTEETNCDFAALAQEFFPEADKSLWR